jgi:PHP family Zn ribbon phosphoesterase
MDSRGVWSIYNKLIEEHKNEFEILLNVPGIALRNFDEKLIDLIIKNREQKIKVEPGFDGEYGRALLGETQAKLI